MDNLWTYASSIALDSYRCDGCDEDVRAEPRHVYRSGELIANWCDQCETVATVEGMVKP